MAEELIVLVDEQGKPTGSAPKLASHHAQTPLHLAFSCYIFNNQGQFLLTRRAASKKVWPGVWTNSVCGHPAPEEKITDAINRRLEFELGLPPADNLEVVLPDYRYRTEPFKGIIENEICPVHTGVLDARPRPNPEEVDDFKWVGWPDLLDDINRDPAPYSFWMLDQLKQLKDHPLIGRLSRQ